MVELPPDFLTSSKNFCMALWTHLSIQPDGNAFPCCIAPVSLGNVNEKSIHDIWNAEPMRAMRRAMLLDEPVPSCAKCQWSEANNLESLRQRLNRWLSPHYNKVQTTMDDGSTAFNLVTLDIRFSNLCNMKCRTCGPHASSKWAEEQGTEHPIVKISDCWEEIETLLPQLENIDFVGGEPLIIEEHYRLLERLIARDCKPSITYASNGSRLGLKHWNVLELWRHFPNIHFQVSIDQVGRKAEYVRHGIRWPVVEQNIRTIRAEAPHVQVIAIPTISIFNIMDLPELIEKFSAETHHISIKNILRGPLHFSIQVLPTHLKQRIDTKLAPLSDTIYAEEISRIRRYLWRADRWDEQRERLKQSLENIDKVRGEQFAEMFPELRELIH